MHRAIDIILKSRGIDEDKREEFFSSRPRLAYDPFLLSNMEAGVDLLLKAIDDDESIVVYGDYDVDGITSTSLLVKLLRSLSDKVSYYIPSRLDEGYGLHKESIYKLYEQGCKLLITVDCGAVSLEETEYAHSLGIKTIVTDHHNISAVQASGILINPMQEGDQYPFKGLAGVGVAYKFALAISRKREIPKPLMAELLEFAAIGTIADIMPMLDENRTIVKCGLRFMHLGCHNKGLRRLIELSGFDYRKIKATDISFGIAPRINAAGRLGGATLGVKLFLAEDDAEIERYCNELIETNRERRALQDAAYDKSLDLVKNEHSGDDFLVLEVNDAHEGVLGIVAGKIRESINRPCIIVSRNGEYYKGTGRSIESVDLFEMLDKYRDEFISFGGHKAACGFTIDASKLDTLRVNLNEDIARAYAQDEHLFDVDFSSDAELSAEEFNMELAEDTMLLEPCGKDNELPLFCIKAVRPEAWRYLKNDKRYAKFHINDETGREIECIIFREAERFEEIVERGELVDVVGNIEINTWRDVSRVQMVVKWVLPSELA